MRTVTITATIAETIRCLVDESKTRVFERHFQAGDGWLTTGGCSLYWVKHLFNNRHEWKLAGYSHDSSDVITDLSTIFKPVHYQ